MKYLHVSLSFVVHSSPLQDCNHNQIIEIKTATPTNHIGFFQATDPLEVGCCSSHAFGAEEVEVGVVEFDSS